MATSVEQTYELRYDRGRPALVIGRWNRRQDAYSGVGVRTCTGDSTYGNGQAKAKEKGEHCHGVTKKLMPQDVKR